MPATWRVVLKAPGAEISKKKLPRRKIHDITYFQQTKDSQPEFDRRTLIKGAAALGAFQVASPFIIQARGETAIRMGMVDSLTGVYAAPAGNE